MMLALSRRSVLGSAAAATVAPIVRVHAAAPAMGAQAPGFYRYKVGSFEVTVVTDGLNRYKFLDDHVGNANRDAINAALATSFMDKDLILNPYNPIVVNTGAKLVLIDAGVGEANYAQSNRNIGQLLVNLAAAEIDAKAIDAVIISHYHSDHLNGLLRADNSLAFPNAEVMVPAVEHKYWMDDGEMSRAPKGRIEGVFKSARRILNAEVSKRVHPYEWGKEVVPGITAVATPGHSPGHTSFVVASGADKVFVQSDLTHVPFLFVRNPGWHAFYDQDPVMAEATRRKTYDMLVAERMRVQGFHFPFPSLAYVEKSGSGYRETFVPWTPTL
jgi:glyoxylase-like metal-dependent hydrolase (beta-lactamase superfamily II)